MVVGEKEKRSRVYCWSSWRRSAALLSIRVAWVVREPVVGYLTFGEVNDAVDWSQSENS